MPPYDHTALYSARLFDRYPRSAGRKDVTELLSLLPVRSDGAGRTRVRLRLRSRFPGTQRCFAQGPSLMSVSGNPPTVTRGWRQLEEQVTARRKEGRRMRRA
eukprot:3475319-Rhodomonas_salina.2